MPEKKDKTHGYLYLIREREFLVRDEQVFKMGMTIQGAKLRLKRLDAYKKESELVVSIRCLVDRVANVEGNIKHHFQIAFTQHSDVCFAAAEQIYQSVLLSCLLLFGRKFKQSSNIKQSGTDCLMTDDLDTSSILLSTDSTVSFTVNNKKVIISKIDYERVIQHKWYMWDGYVHNNKVGYLHTFIMGGRPEKIPDSYVIDHKNREPLNNSRPNLRYVSKSFNSWNSMTQHRSSSRFKGVLQIRSTCKWRAMFLKRYLGYFNDEHSAAKAVAKAAIKEWPIHAIDSDLIVGENLLSEDEM